MRKKDSLQDNSPFRGTNITVNTLNSTGEEFTLPPLLSRPYNKRTSHSTDIVSTVLWMDSKTHHWRKSDKEVKSKRVKMKKSIQEIQMQEQRQPFQASKTWTSTNWCPGQWQAMGKANILVLELVLGLFCQNSKHQLSYHQHDDFSWLFENAETVAEVSIAGLSELLHWPWINFTFIRLGRSLPCSTIW